MYIEAASIFDKYHLVGHVPPVSRKNIDKQLQKLRDEYMSLPLPVENVTIVQDAATLSIASIGLLDIDVTTSNTVTFSSYRYIGVDAEWRAVMTAKGHGVNQGASILQLSTPQYVYIFDLQLLASSELLIASTIRVLKTVFSNEYVIKVGWGFAHNDRIKVQQASGGIQYSVVFIDNFNRCICSVLRDVSGSCGA